MDWIVPGLLCGIDSLSSWLWEHAPWYQQGSCFETIFDTLVSCCNSVCLAGKTILHARHKALAHSPSALGHQFVNERHEATKESESAELHQCNGRHKQHGNWHHQKLRPSPTRCLKYCESSHHKAWLPGSNKLCILGGYWEKVCLWKSVKRWVHPPTLFQDICKCQLTCHITLWSPWCSLCTWFMTSYAFTSLAHASGPSWARSNFKSLRSYARSGISNTYSVSLATCQLLTASLCTVLPWSFS